jgi:hypothetical protein
MTRNEDRPINILAVVTSTGMVPIPELTALLQCAYIPTITSSRFFRTP